jgi:hypothetical protein
MPASGRNFQQVPVALRIFGLLLPRSSPSSPALLLTTWCLRRRRSPPHCPLCFLLAHGHIAREQQIGRRRGRGRGRLGRRWERLRRLGRRRGSGLEVASTSEPFSSPALLHPRPWSCRTGASRSLSPAVHTSPSRSSSRSSSPSMSSSPSPSTPSTPDPIPLPAFPTELAACRGPRRRASTPALSTPSVPRRRSSVPHVAGGTRRGNARWRENAPTCAPAEAVADDACPQPAGGATVASRRAKVASTGRGRVGDGLMPQYTSSVRPQPIYHGSSQQLFLNTIPVSV